MSQLWIHGYNINDDFGLLNNSLVFDLLHYVQ